MTREEYFKALQLGVGATSKANTMLKYINSLEQRIKELETPKTCNTCLYFERSEHEFGHYEGTCLAFIVQNKDFQSVYDSFGCIEYEPKGIV